MGLQLKKGGDSRYIIDKPAQKEYFVIPKGQRIKHIYVETIGTMTGTNNITIGESEAVVETAYFDVTSVASATAGTITIAGVTVTLAAGDITTTTKVAEKIVATAIAGWTVSNVANRVTLVSTGEGNKTDVTAVLGTATNITFSAVTTTQGTLPAEVVSSATVSNTAGTVAQLTIAAGKDIVKLNADKKFYINMETAATLNNINLYVGFCKYN